MLEFMKDSSGVATITLNRPEKHNAFDEHLIAQMTEAFHEVDKDSSIRLMVLAAKGKHFSAGADLEWMKRMATYSYDDNVEDAKSLAEMLRTLNCISKPTIARIQGAVFGGAVGLVSCCDIAHATDTSSFCLSEVKIGLVPATISPYVIAAIGQRAARRYFLSAERFDAKQALACGLVSEICSADELDSNIDVLVTQILANSPKAVADAKRLIFDVSHQPVTNELIEETCKRIANIRVSQEGQEGLTAFLEKRPPSWINDLSSTAERHDSDRETS